MRKEIEIGTTIAVSNYDPATGRFGVVQTVEEQYLHLIGPYVVGVHHADVMYVLDGDAIPRPLNPTLLTGSTLYNVPLPATILIRLPKGDAEFEATDGTVELDFKTPGSHHVTVLSWPFTDAHFDVVVP